MCGENGCGAELCLVPRPTHCPLIFVLQEPDSLLPRNGVLLKVEKTNFDSLVIVVAFTSM